MLLSLSTAIGPVHEKPPLHKGWHKACDNKTGTQCGAYGWWQKCNFISKQQVSRPMAKHKVIRKVISFCKRTAATVRLLQGGQQANSSSVLHHHRHTADEPAVHCSITSAQKTMLHARRLCPSKIGGHWW